MDAIQRTVLEGAAVWNPLKLASVDRHFLKVVHELAATGDGHHLAYQTRGRRITATYTQLTALYTPLTFTPAHCSPVTSTHLAVAEVLSCVDSVEKYTFGTPAADAQTHIRMYTRDHNACPEVLPSQLECTTSPEFVAQWIVCILLSREPPAV